MVVCLWAFCLYDIYHIISYIYLHCKLCFTPEWILKGNIHPHSWQTHVLCLTAQEPMSSVSLIVVSARSLGRRMAKCCCYTLRKRWRCRNMISTICWGVVVVCQMSWIMGLDGWFFWWAVSIYIYISIFMCIHILFTRVHRQFTHYRSYDANVHCLMQKAVKVFFEWCCVSTSWFSYLLIFRSFHTSFNWHGSVFDGHWLINP